jgi:hypothetical protein
VKLLLIIAGLAVFLVISAGLARDLSAASAERGQISTLIDAEARGNAGAMIAKLEGCARAPACRAQQRVNARTLRRGGVIKILNLDPSTRFALGSLTGVTRVAWQREGAPHVTVQCVGIRRTGDVLSGFELGLTSLSHPIGSEASCPGGS